MRTKILSLLGTTLMLSVLSSSFPSLAQSESEEAPEELSPAIMEILCKNFPLNSRCVGENVGTPTAPDSTSDPDADIQGPNAAPDTSPQTPGTEIPNESEDSESMESESQEPESQDSGGMSDPDADTQGPNAAPDTSPQTPGTTFPQ